MDTKIQKASIAPLVFYFCILIFEILFMHFTRNFYNTERHIGRKLKQKLEQERNKNNQC